MQSDVVNYTHLNARIDLKPSGVSQQSSLQFNGQIESLWERIYERRGIDLIAEPSTVPG